MLHYILCESWGYDPKGAKEEILKKINKLLEVAWKPMGGIQVVVIPSEDTGIRDMIYFYQSLIWDDESITQEEMKRLKELHFESLEE